MLTQLVINRNRGCLSDIRELRESGRYKVGGKVIYEYDKLRMSVIEAFIHHMPLMPNEVAVKLVENLTSV